MPRHPDFEKIYQNFVKQYGKEKGEAYYYAWLNKNGLDDTKPYQVEAQYLKESFSWIQPEIEKMKEDEEAVYYKVRALTANMSMNKNDYRDYQYMMKVAPSLGWRPLNLNHDHDQWLPYPDARIYDARFEDMSVEATMRIPKTLPNIVDKIEKGLIIHPSVEGDPLKAHWVGDVFIPDQYVFTAMALLEKGKRLPGDPLTTIEPLFMKESLGQALVESLKNGTLSSLAQSQIGDKEMKEIPQCEPGYHWDPEQKTCVKDDIPADDSVGQDFQIVGPEQTLPLVAEGDNLIAEYLKETIKLKRTLADKTTEINELTMKLNTETRGHSETKRKLQESVGKNSELERLKLEDMENLSMKEEEIRRNDEKIGSLNGQLSAKTREINKINTQLNTVKTEIDKLSTKHGDIMEQNIHNLSELNKTTTDLMGANQELTKTRKDHISLQGEIAKATEENAGLLRQNADLSDRLVEQTKKIVEHAKTIDELKQYNAVLQDKVKKASKLAKQIIVKV